MNTKLDHAYWIVAYLSPAKTIIATFVLALIIFAAWRIGYVEGFRTAERQFIDKFKDE